METTILRRSDGKIKRKTLLTPLHPCVEPHCRKCGAVDGLVKHHVIALADGGPDTGDNLIWLCEEDHDEWHDLEGIPYLDMQAWLSVPPARVLVASYWLSYSWSGTKEAMDRQMVRAWASMFDHIEPIPLSV